MKKTVLTVALLWCVVMSYAQRLELLPYGDFDTWAVRYITESGFLGGKTKALYMIAPTDTVYGTKYTRCKKSPWSSGNALAQSMGITKVSVSVVPEKRGDGYCCRMETRLDTVHAGTLHLNALVTGSIYTGILADPVTLAHSNDPNSAIDMGMPFTKRPKALVLDYKAVIKNGTIIKAAASRKIKKLEGLDAGQIVMVLQYRWEEKGHIYAYRVGTATEYIRSSTKDWQNAHRVPVVYGELPEGADQPWSALCNNRFKARNSKGKMVCIEEIGWRGDLEPTHVIVQVSSGCQQPFTGCPGNIVWVDNIGMEY